MTANYLALEERIRKLAAVQLDEFREAGSYPDKTTETAKQWYRFGDLLSAMHVTPHTLDLAHQLHTALADEMERLAKGGCPEITGRELLDALAEYIGPVRADMHYPDGERVSFHVSITSLARYMKQRTENEEIIAALHVLTRMKADSYELAEYAWEVLRREIAVYADDGAFYDPEFVELTNLLFNFFDARGLIHAIDGEWVVRRAR